MQNNIATEITIRELYKSILDKQNKKYLQKRLCQHVPHINQISRPKQNTIPPLKLPPEKASLVPEAGITIYNTNKDTEDNVR